MLLSRRLLPILITATLLLVNGLAAATAAEEKPIVVTTTSVLGSVVEDLAGEHVQVIVLVNPSICPAHYDVKPSDLYAVSKAKLILYHGMEGWLMQLYNASGSKAKLVKISGGWATLDGAKSYYRQVAEALESGFGLDVSEKLEERLSELDQVAEQVLGEAEMKAVTSINVIVMKWQRAFIEWLGFNVVGDFGPPEKLSSSDIEKLISLGRERNVAIVISNLQSGTDVGEAIAREIGAVHVILTNFPGSSPEIKSLADLIERNAEEVFKAISLYQLKRTLMEMRDEVEFYSVGFYALLVVAVVEAAGIAYLARRLKAVG